MLFDIDQRTRVKRIDKRFMIADLLRFGVGALGVVGGFFERLN